MQICMRLGWRPPDNKFGKFDILPLVLQPNGKDPEFFIIPEDLVMEVHLTHPELVILLCSMLFCWEKIIFCFLHVNWAWLIAVALARDLL